MKYQILDLLKDKTFHHRDPKALAAYLQLDKASDFISLMKELNKLEDQGLLVRNKHNEYYLPDSFNMASGILSLNKAGFGFVACNQDKDIYINSKNLKGALHGDRVLLEITSKKESERPEGTVIRVLEHTISNQVGLLKRIGSRYFVDPDDSRLAKPIYVDQAHLHGAVVNNKVLVKIKAYHPYLKGDILEIIGHKDDPGIDILSLVYASEAPLTFPPEVMVEVAKTPSQITKKDLAGRLDLRDKLIVTIDGDDAKDLDDAVSLETNDQGNYLLGVHIADVSHYVAEGSYLDKSAFARGTSIYLVDRVIPMLPHKLSNGICSLNEGEDRLTISCFMEVSPSGKVLDDQVNLSVINSKHRMTYNDVNALLAGKQELITKYRDTGDLFPRMAALAQVLNKNRIRKGAIDFDVKEAKVLVDAKGKPTDVVLRHRGTSEHIIEEFMLLANVTIAQKFNWLDLPFIYRIHENPEAKKLQQFAKISQNLGYPLRGPWEKIKPSALQKIINDSKGKPDHSIIATLLLRSMQKARYDSECLGHFGLADDYYTHFTSPIRRYPDLIVHRLIHRYLFEGKVDRSTINHYQEQMPIIALKASNCERRAINLERAVDDMKMAEYMADHIGEEFIGVISSVVSFGFFVELDNTIEGLVKVETLTDDYYNFIEDNLMFKGERTGRIFKMSQEVRVKVVAASKLDRTIDFEVVGLKPTTKRQKIRRRKRRR